MRAKHSPGPWRIHPRTTNGPNALILSADDEFRAEVYTYPADADEAEANARLIAAAPELLAALEAMVHTYDLFIEAGGEEHQPENVERARAAIAKARGKP